MRRSTFVLSLATLLVVLVAAPSRASVTFHPTPVSGASPFTTPGCEGAPQTGTLYPNAEVEPWVDANPAVPGNLIGVWQQDRFSNGGARGLLSAYSTDGGATWTEPGLGDQPTFSRCAGGNPTNGGDFERASDPWVSFGPDGDAFQIALSVNDSNFDHAVLVSRSFDGGATWEPTNKTLLREDDPNVFNDKESITADPTDADNVYAVWDRLVFPTERARGASAERALAFKGPAVFTRTTDDGDNWEPVRPIYDPGRNNQTIGNQIVVLPDGTLVDVFNDIHNFQNKHGVRGFKVSVIRSEDQGATWSQPIVVDRLGAVGVRDPRDGHRVRTGDIIPDIAVGPAGELYVVWQDARFTGGARDQIAFASSTDGGLTWTTRSTAVSSNLATQAFTASADVADDGTIAVTYYDFTPDTTATTTLDTQYWITRSSDGGANWSPREAVGPVFDMANAPDARGYFTGDYEGLASEGTEFKLFVVEANTGDTANRTDVFSASSS